MENEEKTTEASVTKEADVSAPVKKAAAKKAATKKKSTAKKSTAKAVAKSAPLATPAKPQISPAVESVAKLKKNKKAVIEAKVRSRRR